MLIGQFARQIDQNGQFNIPDTFLSFLVSGSIATYGLDGNLYLFPLSYWEHLANEVVQLSFSKEVNRSFRRFLFSSAMNLTPNKEGQIALSPQLKRFAGIEQEIMLVGVHHYIEIWNEKAWNLEHNQFTDSLSNNKTRWESLGV